MISDRAAILAEIQRIVASSVDRRSSMQATADVLKNRGGFRWVGLYDVDTTAGVVNNVVWSGPGAPAFPSFLWSEGLTGAAIIQKKTVNVGDVMSDARYLTAFGSTRSEIIVPVFDEERESVLGTIDIESEEPYSFDPEVQRFVEACAVVAQPLWRR